MTSMDIDEEEIVAETPKLGNIESVTMHPLVLLSAADHYHRVARGTRKRVVGILLGSVIKGEVDCTNSFAVPFEEDSRNPVRFFHPIAFHFLYLSRIPHCFIYGFVLVHLKLVGCILFGP